MTDLVKLRELEKAATAGPWSPRGLMKTLMDAKVRTPLTPIQAAVDAALIAALRNAAPRLLTAAEECERMRARIEKLEKALRDAVRIAELARDEWDKAPSGMRVGKLLVALSGNLPGYRADIDSIHSALSQDDQ